MISGRFIRPGGDISDAMQIWRKVFIYDMGLPSLPEEQSLLAAVCLVIYDAQQPIAAGCISQRGEIFSLGLIAVDEKHRGTGIGDMLMRMLLDKAERAHISKLEAHVHPDTAEFFAKYCFNACGDIIIRQGMRVIPMCADLQEVNRKLFSGGCDGCENNSCK